MKALLSILVIFSSLTFAQENSNWVKLQGIENQQIYIDKNNIQIDSVDVTVFVMQSHIPALNIESVSKPIYKSETEYLFNTKIQRYSIRTITYYDAKNRLLDTFKYNTKTDLENYKYSYPIFENSTEKKILDTIFYYKPELKPKESK